MSTFTVISMTPTEPNGLASTPNVTEMEHIRHHLNTHQVPEIKDLMAGPITIVASYRGWNLYCGGGVTVYRDSPVSEGGHGYAGSPVPGTIEDVTISSSSGWFKCSVLFNV